MNPHSTSLGPTKPLIIIAGPTASGKSALALDVARRFGGTIINADAMQCYADWRIITARPSVADEAAAPHRLYGVRSLDQLVDAAWWRAAAIAELNHATLPILCGGTGLYLSALINGISDIPDPGPQARAQARAMLAEHGAPGLHHWLMANDPATGSKLRPTDSQRLARATEVWLGTGRGLAAWHAMPRDRLTGYRIFLLRLDPPRDDLRAAIATRFRAMLEAGALEEVRNVHARNLNPALPGLRAHGVPELMAHCAGNLTLADAAACAITATIAYTKRQGTWFRHQKLADERNSHMMNARFDGLTQLSETNYGSIVSFINHEG
ncbi:MAG: tRNA (adenosine(37)-N6)-dimethylallyltransferase MiaA [Acidiphilium sp.]|nr:tRNA (adenosine(37)-N6)-dimethylallyltransferase MiaA [Acidiphilium sp.]MDD4936042.1 tRNA (adenosine(37)-N6)-dimethylallyltransferase MiaA [Acidiphilium sp.]